MREIPLLTISIGAESMLDFMEAVAEARKRKAGLRLSLDEYAGDADFLYACLAYACDREVPVTVMPLGLLSVVSLSLKICRPAIGD